MRPVRWLRRRSRTSPGRPPGGFTLIELLTTIAIAAILLAVAAPSFQQFKRNSELTASVNTLVATLGTARAEAMKRQLDVYVTPANGAWAQGWTVWVDADLDGVYSSSSVPPDVLVLTQQALPATVSVTPSANFGSYIRFNGAGFPQPTPGGPLGTQQLVFSNGTESRNLLISPTGRVRACKPDIATCDASTEW